MLSTSQSYVRMEPVSASVRAGAYMGGVLEVEFSLDIPDEVLREQARAQTLRLRDGYVTALSSYGSAGYRAGQCRISCALPAFCSSPPTGRSAHVAPRS